MRLYIIRHGHVTYRRGIPLNSVPPEERSYLPDPALTEVGRKQAVLLGEHLSRRLTRRTHRSRCPWIDRASRLRASSVARCGGRSRRRSPWQPRLASGPRFGWTCTNWAVYGTTKVTVKARADFRGSPARRWKSSSPASSLQQTSRMPVGGTVRPSKRLSISHVWWAWRKPYAPWQRAQMSTLPSSLTVPRPAISCMPCSAAMLTKTLTFNHSNTGITSLTFRENEIVLRYLNRLEHLPDELITL